MQATETSSLARQLFEAFEVAERENGERFIRLREGSPSWMMDVAREAHGEMFPDDWRYEAIRLAAESIAERDDEDAAHEYADSICDVYTGRLTAWLGSNIQRAGYCDEVMAEGIVNPDNGIVAIIQAGQYAEAREVYHAVRGALEQQAARSGV